MAVYKNNEVSALSRAFTRALLNDVNALDFMLKNNLFEEDIVRIGAEQEICLVDAKNMNPVPINMSVIKKMNKPSWLQPEMAKFNLETNLTPHEFTENCLSEMEQECQRHLEKIRTQAQTFGADIVLAGTLPTLRRYDVEMHNITPKPRYKEMLGATKAHLNASHHRFNIMGIDELILQHESSLLPTCCTSFQLHLQVAPKNFAKYYNIAQAISGPIMAITANSPLVFGKRLWHESRMILCRQASDTYVPMDYIRERRPRYHFGYNWIKNSVIELYREDVSRFPIYTNAEMAEEDPMTMIKAGKTPGMKALQAYNSTAYRWNRPCYGISPNGQAHLRIENRYIPAGPSVIDEIANAAFSCGKRADFK